MSNIPQFKYFFRAFILLTWLTPVIASDNIKEEDKNFLQSPIRPKSEIIYKGTPEKTKTRPSIDTPLRLERASLENSRLESTNTRLQSTIDDLVRIITDDRFVRPAFAHLFRAIVEGQDNRTIGNLLRRVEEVRRPPILELPVDFDKKIRRSVTESALYLINDELNIRNGRKTNFPTINYLTFKPFRDVSSQEVRDLTATLRNLSVRDEQEDQIVIGRSALVQLVSKSLKEPIIDLETEIDLGALPKLLLHQYSDFCNNPGIYEWYMIGSAIPDGDCFFHAIFTKDGEKGTVVKQNAFQIRRRVIEETEREEDSQRAIRLEMLGYYRELRYKLRNDLVPKNINSMLDKNDDHAILRNSKLDKLNGDVDQLPEKFRNNVRYDDEAILNAISFENIQQYMTKYLNSDHDEYYIEVPVGRNYPTGISELIARKNNITVNYFILNRERAALNYAGTLAEGNPNIYNLLIDGRHFYPLYNDQEDESKKENFIQSLNNFVEFVDDTYFGSKKQRE